MTFSYTGQSTDFVFTDTGFAQKNDRLLLLSLKYILQVKK